MSSYKSAIRSPQQQDPTENKKFRAEARQLQELFPSWSNNDLIFLLTEVGGDVQVAATKISDGTVEPWGEVSRKKDKKAPASAHSKSTNNAVVPTGARGDSRGARGGRGGRGGLGRGGAVARGRGGPPRGTTNGHGHPAATSTATPTTNGTATSGSVDASAKPEAQDSTTTATSTEAGSAWTNEATPVESVSAAPAPPVEANGSAVAPVPTTPAGKLAPSKPATSKMSWAQIARPHEKPAPPPVTAPAPAPPAPTQQPQQQTHAPSPAPQPTPSAPAPEPEVQENGWEEPTTAEAPTWDEPPTKTQEAPAVAEAWPPSITEAPLEPEAPATVVEEPAQAEVAEEKPVVPEHVVETKPEPTKVAEPTPVLATLASSSHVAAAVAATPSPKLTSRSAAGSHRQSRYKIPDQPVTMPLSFGTGIEKVGMQFGSLSLAGDGSVFEQSEPEAPTVAPTPVPESPQAKAPEPVAAPPPATAPASSTSLTPVFQQQQTAQPAQPPATQTLAPPQTTALHHTLPTSVSQPITSNQTASHPATTSPLLQFSQQHQQQAAAAAAAQQQSLVNNTPPHQPQQSQQQQHHQQPPHIHQQHQQQQAQQQQHQQQQSQQHLQHLPQQVQQQNNNHSAHHAYTQHGLPTHIDPAQQQQQQQTQTPVQQQPLQSTAHSSYFRQADGGAANAPYFHTPTPPAAQDSPYGSFGQLGQQTAHQQASHLGGFASTDYGYGETARGFYDQYNQPSAFGARNPLGHDDIKSLPGSQQPAPTALTPSTAQASQQHSSQAANQPQVAGGQGPQQSYPPPVPYYYTHAYPQNQYYGTPYSSAYAPQPFVKYPTMFPPGPPGPGSAVANPAAKQPAGNVGVGGQPQTNPYTQNLYQQQAAYDDYQQHHSQHQHQHSHSLGLSQGGVGVGSGDYGKQLYGGAAQGGGMQGFMGLGAQSSGAGGVQSPASAGPRNAASPEAAYKPYAAKDVAAAGGRGAPVQQGGQQPQGQGQGPAGQGGPQGQSFYGNRFTSGVSGAGSAGVGGGPQQQHQQGGPHLGYPQGGSEPNFYGYQPRQQQGYWQ